MVHTRGQQAGAVSPANPGSSTAAGDSVAFQATNVASSGLKAGPTSQSLHLSGTPTSGSPASGSPAGRTAAQQGVLEKSTCIGTQIGVSTCSDDPLHIRTDTDESGDEHHTQYGVGTGIRGDSGVFGTSGARVGAQAVLLGAYQGASQPVFQPAYMGHSVAHSGLNGQTNVVGSDYCMGVPSVAGVPISAPVVTLVSTRASTGADVRPRDYSAPARSETTDTHLRDRRLAQYAAKERRENARDESELLIGQYDYADPEETRGWFSSQAGILQGTGHGWIPCPDLERRPGYRPYSRSEH